MIEEILGLFLEKKLLKLFFKIDSLWYLFHFVDGQIHIAQIISPEKQQETELRSVDLLNQFIGQQLIYLEKISSQQRSGQPESFLLLFSDNRYLKININYEGRILLNIINTNLDLKNDFLENQFFISPCSLPLPKNFDILKIFKNWLQNYVADHPDLHWKLHETGADVERPGLYIDVDSEKTIGRITLWDFEIYGDAMVELLDIETGKTIYDQHLVFYPGVDFDLRLKNFWRAFYGVD